MPLTAKRPPRASLRTVLATILRQGGRLTTALELKVENLEKRVESLEALFDMLKADITWYAQDRDYVEPEPPLEREEGEDG